MTKKKIEPTDKQILRVAKALWKYEVTNNEHDELFNLSWYEGQAKAAFIAAHS